MARLGTRWLVLGVTVVSALTLTGCSSPPWLGAGDPGGVASASPTPSPSATGEIETIVNDLASGSTRRELSAGSLAVTVDYWSDLNMGDWTAAANKPVSFSLSAALANDEGQQVYLSRVSLVAAVIDDGGSLPAPATISDTASVSPGYLITAPYSYSQTFVLPAVDQAATSVTLSLTYEMLLQTTPTSAEYSKQTATDTLTIALAGLESGD